MKNINTSGDVNYIVVVGLTYLCNSFVIAIGTVVAILAIVGVTTWEPIQIAEFNRDLYVLSLAFSVCFTVFSLTGSLFGAQKEKRLPKWYSFLSALLCLWLYLVLELKPNVHYMTPIIAIVWFLAFHVYCRIEKLRK